jgi:hypothetical protein
VLPGWQLQTEKDERDKKDCVRLNQGESNQRGGESMKEKGKRKKEETGANFEVL